MRSRKDQLYNTMKYDTDSSSMKVPIFIGDTIDLMISAGSTTLNGKERFISFNLPDNSKIRATVIHSRDKSYEDTLYITDILKFGKNDLSCVSFGSRFEVLDLVCTTLPSHFNFKMFGSRCIAPYVFIATNIGATACLHCPDPRVLGFRVISLSEIDSSISVLRADEHIEDVNSPEEYPPVENESTRVMGYVPLIKSMIRKLSGKWKDVYLSHHQPSLLPYDSDDLMQFGLMQVTIALRRYKPDNPQGAQEATFVYQHLWNRYGQIAHKYSKQSNGYGAPHIRDTIDKNGELISAYDFIKGKSDDD